MTLWYLPTLDFLWYIYAHASQFLPRDNRITSILFTSKMYCKYMSGFIWRASNHNTHTASGEMSAWCMVYDTHVDDYDLCLMTLCRNRCYSRIAWMTDILCSQSDLPTHRSKSSVGLSLHISGKYFIPSSLGAWLMHNRLHQNTYAPRIFVNYYYAELFERFQIIYSGTTICVCPTQSQPIPCLLCCCSGDFRS